MLHELENWLSITDFVLLLLYLLNFILFYCYLQFNILYTWMLQNILYRNIIQYFIEECYICYRDTSYI